MSDPIDLMQPRKLRNKNYSVAGTVYLIRSDGTRVELGEATKFEVETTVLTNQDGSLQTAGKQVVNITLADTAEVDVLTDCDGHFKATIKKGDGFAVTTKIEPTLTPGDWQLAKTLLRQARDRINVGWPAKGLVKGRHCVFSEGYLIAATKKFGERTLVYRKLMLKHAIYRINPSNDFAAFVQQIAERPNMTMVAAVATVVAKCRVTGTLKL